VPDCHNQEMKSEVNAWQQERNNKQAKINWQFTNIIDDSSQRFCVRAEEKGSQFLKKNYYKKDHKFFHRECSRGHYSQLINIQNSYSQIPHP